MGAAQDRVEDDYAASDGYYARRDARNARDLDRAIDLGAHLVAIAILTEFWRRFTDWVFGQG